MPHRPTEGSACPSSVFRWLLPADPRDAVEVRIEAGDSGTIAKVNEKLAELHWQGVHHVRLITFDDPPINKPHGLNVRLRDATGDVVTIFDAEDEPHRDILRIVNT